MNKPSIFSTRLLPACLCMALVACAGGPPAPEWQMNAKGALDRSVAAYLAGESRVEAQEFERARNEVARTGRLDLLARIELVRCAARVASAVPDDCADFEKLRQDAAEPERAYANFLAFRMQPHDLELLPPQYRAVAAVRSDADPGAMLKEISDPLSRLIAAGVLFRAGRASPGVLSLAVDTASSQGWRRPLLSWLGIQALRAQQAGEAQEAQRLQRRIEFVRGAELAPKH